MPNLIGQGSFSVSSGLGAICFGQMMPYVTAPSLIAFDKAIVHVFAHVMVLLSKPYLTLAMALKRP
jgi:hypothetical protein